MHPSRYPLIAAAFLGLAPAALHAQETAPAAEAAPGTAPAGASPAAEAPALEPAPAPDAPSAEVPAPDAASPAEAAPTLEPAPTPGTPAPAAEAPAAAPDAPAAEAPAQPEIDVTEHGDWDVGCLAGTESCEMQQVALDASGNPVVLVRVIKLPEAEEAEALAIVNTPLGTLLPSGLGFQIDGGEASALPFEWCVQEGCIVRLGLREPDVTALKRGSAVRLRVASIADPDQPVELNLSLSGFTAAYDSLGVPPAQAAPADPAQLAPAPQQ